MQLLKKHLFIFLLMSLTCHSSAQDSTAMLDYNMKFNVAGRYITGTFNQFVVSNGLDLNLKYNNWVISKTVSYRYNKTGNRTIENNWYQLFSASYLLIDKLFFPTMMYHFDNNLMFQVEERHLLAGGISSALDWGKQRTRVDLGAGYEYTKYTSGQFENSDLTSPIRSRPIAITRLLVENNLFAEKMTLTNDLFYRHSLVNGSLRNDGVKMDS